MKELLVVVDMQKDFIDGSLGSAEAQKIVGNVAEKIRQARREGVSIAFTLDTHGGDYMETQEGKRLPVAHCIKGTPGWELADELKEFEGTCFEKPVFGSRKLAQWAEEQQFERIELVGLCTDICVISNALLLKTFLPECEISVDASCCAGVTPESHQNALEAMKMCQIVIR